jgi:c(7)-type cytochrome triheme protein
MGPCFLYANDFFNIPPQPPPERYGNILINRTSKNHDVQAATFSHWSHRIGYACRVCHTELEFNFQLNTTKITEKANMEGKFCGACHNGKDAFGRTKGNCEKCHNGNIDFGREKFAKLKGLPRAPDGNGVDWVAAVKKGAIKPKRTLAKDYRPVVYEGRLVLAPDWNLIPPVSFPIRSILRCLIVQTVTPTYLTLKRRRHSTFPWSGF